MTHPMLPRGAELRLPIVSGVLLTLSFPPFHLLIPPFLALVPYLVFLGGLARGDAGDLSPFRASLWMGIVYYGTLLYWLFTALVFYTWLALLGYVLTVTVLSLFLAVAGWAVYRLRRDHGTPFWLSLPVFWTAMEWLRGNLGDLSFPWLGLGHSLTGFPALIGFAELTGARGVTLWLVAINGLLAEWWLEGWRRRWVPRSVALLLLLAVPVGFSLVRWVTLETRPVARVLVVQPNIPEDLKMERQAAVDSSQRALAHLTERTLAETRREVDLVAWPETALPVSLDLAREWGPWAASLARSHGVALVYGLVDVDVYPDGMYDYYNAALFTDEEGVVEGIYHKHHLVPMVERVPYIPIARIRAARRSAARGWNLPLIGDVGRFLQYFGGFGRGSSEPVFPAGAGGFGVLICYESTFAGLSRAYRRAGADFVVNLTNDAWYGRERPIWSRTSALYQHPAHLVMRAIENRIGVARSANTGISLFVDPRGRVYEATHLFEADARVADVLTTDARTLYTRIGDWPGTLAAVGAALVLGLIGWRRRRGRAGEA